MEANFLARLSSSDEYDMALELYMDIYIYIYIYINAPSTEGQEVLAIMK